MSPTFGLPLPEAPFLEPFLAAAPLLFIALGVFGGDLAGGGGAGFLPNDARFAVLAPAFAIVFFAAANLLIGDLVGVAFFGDALALALDPVFFAAGMGDVATTGLR